MRLYSEWCHFQMLAMLLAAANLGLCQAQDRDRVDPEEAIKKLDAKGAMYGRKSMCVYDQSARPVRDLEIGTNFTEADLDLVVALTELESLTIQCSYYDTEFGKIMSK